MALQAESERNYELLKIQNENKIRAENEKSIRDAETQIRLAEIGASSSNITVSKSQTSVNEIGCKQIKDSPPLRSTDRDDIENFFLHFERSCAINSIPEEKYCSYSTAKLPIEMVQILTRVPLEMANDYKLFRSNVAQKYFLTSDFYKKKFYSLSFQQGDSNAEFINKLQDALQRWLDAEKVEKNYESIFEFILKTQYYRKIDIQKLILIKEHRLESLNQITDLADVCDVAHSGDESKNRARYNNFPAKSNRGVSTSQNTTQNVDKPLCNFCLKRDHTEENCYSKNDSQKPGKLNCSFCGKKKHAILNCYAENGRPQGNPNQNAGPKPTSTPLDSKAKQKRTHQVAAVNIIQPFKTSMAFENSSLKTNRLQCDEFNDEGNSYSLLDTVQTDTTVFNSCTVVIANERSHDDKILNPYSKATIGDSDVEHTVLRDSGSFVSIIMEDLVPANCYTNRKVSLQFADGNITSVQTALVKINCKFFKRTMEFAVISMPVTPTIIGNMRHVTEDFKEQDKKINFVPSQVQTKPTNNQTNVQHEITFKNKINQMF